MLDPHQILLAVPLLPVLGALLCALFGSVKQLKSWSHVPAVLCAALSCACAFGVVAQLQQSGLPATFPGGDSDRIVWFGMDYAKARLVVEFGLSADHLAGIMLIGVTFIGFGSSCSPSAT